LQANHYSGDIRGVNPATIPDFDLLCAGFPCQAFSVAGKRKGFQDTRGTLFFEILRVAEAKRPALLLLENVKGLLNHDGGRTFTVILQSLDELGYWVEWQVLNSKHFGVPQNRERVFIIGHSRNGGTKPIFPITEADGVADQGPSEEGEYSTAIDANYYKGIDKHGQRQGIIVESALIHSRGLETRQDGVSHCLKGSGGGSSKNMLVGPFIQNIPHGYNDGFKKALPSLKANKGAQYNELLVQPVLRWQNKKEGIVFDDLIPTLRASGGADIRKKPVVIQIKRHRKDGDHLIRTYENETPTLTQQMGTGGGNVPLVQPVLTPDRLEKRQHGRRFKDDGEPSFTLTGQDVHGVMIANTVDQDGYLRREARNRDENGNPVITSIGERRIRRLTPTECERLQAFPDGWTEWGIDENGEKVKISDTQRYRALGNAVTTSVITFLGKHIRESIISKSKRIDNP